MQVQSGLLVHLDLSAAFDMVSHSLLLDCMQHCLSISATDLYWLKFYLTDGKDFVNLGDFKSLLAPVTQGVPQGSVLGTLLFLIYMLPLGEIIQRHGLSFHCFADDTQIYVSTSPSNLPPSAHLPPRLKAWPTSFS